MKEATKTANFSGSIINEVNLQNRQKSLNLLRDSSPKVAERPSFFEFLINHNPIQFSLFYYFLFKAAGIKIGKNVRFLGHIRLKIRGKASNIEIGNDVVLGPNVDFRNRENGRIILRDRVYLDGSVRIVAARDGIVELGFGCEVGQGTVINSGGIVKIGEFTLIAGNVSINSSTHGTKLDQFIKEQPHTHSSIIIGSDVFIGSCTSIVTSTKINDGAVISANSLVSGEIPAYCICMGVPARAVRLRM